jgi:hypothetical protein
MSFWPSNQIHPMEKQVNYGLAFRKFRQAAYRCYTRRMPLKHYICVFLLLVTSSLATAYTPEESRFIADWNSYTHKVKQQAFSFDALIKEYFSTNEDPRVAQIVFFGENHGDAKLAFAQRRALEFLVRDGDIILVEGWKAGQPPVDCVTDFSHAILQSAWENRKDRKIDQNAFIEQWLKLRQNTRKDLDAKSLRQFQAKCFGWDDPTYFFWGNKHLLGNKLPPLFEPLMKRNVSMAAEIKRHLGSGHRIFVIAGRLHLPCGDFDNFEAREPFSQDLAAKLNHFNLNSYYRTMKTGLPTTPRNRIEQMAYTSSEVIYDLIRGLSYAELIPYSLMKTPCDSACL